VHFIILGGAALAEKRAIWWNFVSSRKERIVQAAEDWREQRMGKIDGDNEFIPLRL
jgi:redox-sensitive bicupin YhaK (pirin superfamily)